MGLFSDRYEVARANAGYPHRELEEDRVETLTGTLMERVGALVDAREPLLTTTPTSIAIRGLAARIDALEHAVREIALEVHKLAAHELSAE